MSGAIMQPTPIKSAAQISTMPSSNTEYERLSSSAAICWNVVCQPNNGLRGKYMRLRVNGVHISIEQRGEAGQRPLVLLHGFTGSARGWGSLLDKLANGFHVIALDMLGH